MGRSDSRPSLSPHFVAFAWRYHPCVGPLLPATADARSRASGLWCSGLPNRNCRWRRTGLPGSQGPLVCLGPVLRPRRDRARQAIAACPTRPPPLTRTRAPTRSFRGSIARPWHSLSTLRGEDHSSPRQTRFRLPARLCRAGFVHPQGSNEKFPSFESLPPLLSFPGAMSFQVSQREPELRPSFF